MTKLLENIYRCVNIALVNELKLLCLRMGIDIWEVIDAASTKPFGFHPFYPGPGLGGHCIPIDPSIFPGKPKSLTSIRASLSLPERSTTACHIMCSPPSAAGQVAPNFGIDNMVLFMRGPDDGQLRVALREDSGIKLAEFRERLRKVLPERVIPWLAKRLEQGGLSPAEAERQAKLSTFGFEPGDIVTNVMSFGSLTPIAVRVVGTDLKMVRQHAEKIAAAMKRIPFLRDVQFEQTLDYPTVEVDIDREKAGLSAAPRSRTWRMRWSWRRRRPGSPISTTGST